MARIGPTFPEELRAAGVSDFRFSWARDTGKIEYHPDMPASERAKVEAVLAAHDGPLSEARHQAREAVNAEGGRQIAEMFGRPPGSDKLIWAQMNANARASQLMKRVIEGTALPEERLELERLDGIYDRIGAILQAGDVAKAALVGAKDVAEVQAIKPAWPKD
jgi:hypothetical protein